MNAEAPLIELLAHSALKGAAVLGMALLLGLSLHSAAAARRYAVWLTAVVMLGILPLALLVLPAWRVLPQAQLASTPLPELAMPEAAMTEAPPAASVAKSAPALKAELMPASMPPILVPQKVAPPTFRLTWDAAFELLPGLWLTITGLLLLRLAWGARCLHRLEKTLAPGASELLHETAHEMGLRHAPRLLIGAENAVPMVWGIWRPRLLLPLGFETWSREKLRGVLLHELAHLKRRDPLALWAAQWVKALHWFNPLAWLTLRQLRADQERACDDTVLRHGMRPSDYAQHLLDLSRHARLAPGLSLCALTITRCAPVESRVKAILDPRRSRESLTLRWLLGMAALALLTTLSVAMLHAIEGPKLRGRILDRNGVVLAETTAEKARHYPLKALAPNVIGRVKQTANKVPQPESTAGIEKQQDEALRSGKDISLTLDARVQSLAARAMTDAGHTRGAVVVLDPRTGAILAMVSLPSYDPNRFAPAFDRVEWATYDRSWDKPLWDRCANIVWQPSAAYTPLTALAAISAGVADKTFDCQPATTSAATRFVCARIKQGGAGHGSIGLEGALQHSCRHYWCQLGLASGLDAFGKVGTKIGFGQTYGVLDVESPGTLPLSTAEWRERHRGRKLSEADTASLAEGAGLAQVTPLQMAVLAATVASSGPVPQPTLLQSGAAPVWRADLVQDGLPVAQIQQLREGMRLAVSSGDGQAHAAQSGKVSIAGSFGTMRCMAEQDEWETHEWFIGFAPYDAPRLAFAVLAQCGNTAKAGAASVARRVVEETLALPEDGSGHVPPMQDTADREAMRLKLAQFGIKRDGIAGAVSKAEKETGAGLVIKSRQIEDWSVTLRCEAASLNQAVQFRDKLSKLGKEFRLMWKFPMPSPGKDGKPVEFQAVGTVELDDKTLDSGFWKLKRASNEMPESLKAMEELGELRTKLRKLEAEQPLNQAAIDKLKKSEQTQAAYWHASRAPAKAIRADQMPAADLAVWKVAKKAGALADLPQEATAHVREVEPQGWAAADALGAHFWFSAPREEVRTWLMASLPERTKTMQAAMLVWPEPVLFHRVYFTGNGCTIVLHSLDGKTVFVEVTPNPRSPNIAPDEATPPRPKTAAPRELDGVVDAGTSGTGSPWLLRFTENDPALEQLFVESGQLLPTPIVPERVQNVLARTNPFQKQPPLLDLSAPIRLPKAPLFPGKRFQQSLLVALPDGQ